MALIQYILEGAIGQVFLANCGGDLEIYRMSTAYVSIAVRHGRSCTTIAVDLDIRIVYV